MHEFLSDFLVDNDSYEDAHIGIEDAIEFNEYESKLLVKYASENKNDPGEIRKLMSVSNKGKPSPIIAKNVAFKSELNINRKTYR